MFETHFYHATFKTAIKIFGRLFSNIFIKRENDELIPVTITFSSKDKILQKYYTWLNGTIEDQQQIILPKIGFTMGDPQVDKSRQLNRLHRLYPKPGIDKTPASYNSIPFIVPFTLSIMSKNLDDMFQIVEQIVPFFFPDFTITVTDNPQLKINTDYIYKIDSISQETDSWDGTFDDRRIIVWTINFTCELNLYHPVKDSHLIKKIVNEWFTSDALDDRFFKDILEVNPGTENASGDFELIATSIEEEHG